MNTLFAYNDVVSPGSSIIALAVDVIWLTGITIALDYVEWSYVASSIAAMLRRKELVGAFDGEIPSQDRF